MCMHVCVNPCLLKVIIPHEPHSASACLFSAFWDTYLKITLHTHTHVGTSHAGLRQKLSCAVWWTWPLLSTYRSGISSAAGPLLMGTYCGATHEERSKASRRDWNCQKNEDELDVFVSVKPWIIKNKKKSKKKSTSWSSSLRKHPRTVDPFQNECRRISVQSALWVQEREGGRHRSACGGHPAGKQGSSGRPRLQRRLGTAAAEDWLATGL